ncbi:MAG: hypothetical protein ACXW3D_04185 [Caulobacteraceae bacterium]
MPRSTDFAAVLSKPLMTGALAAFAGAALLWLAGMGRGVWLTALYGPICGVEGHGLNSPHCPACYAAAALLAVGAGFGVLALRRTAKSAPF